ncbi:competence protein ComK [Virgibacillus ainsalahensis]
MGEVRAIYLINRKTKAIIFNDDGYHRSLILEVGKECYSMHRPEQILAHSCLHYGSDVEGRRKAVKNILKSIIKLPLPISTDGLIYMMPTASIRNKDCVWVGFHHIAFIEQRDQRGYIGFRDGSGIYVNATATSLDMQYKRTSQVIISLSLGRMFELD